MNIFEYALKRNEHCQLPLKVITQDEVRNLPKHDVWRYRNFDSFLNSLYDMLYYEYDIPLEINPNLFLENARDIIKRFYNLYLIKPTGEVILQHKSFEEIIKEGEKND